MWIWLCEDKLKVKVGDFRLPSASQKRACLNSLLDPRPRHWTRDRDFGPTTRDPRLLVKLVCEVRRSDKCSSISIFAVIYLKLLVQIDSLFSVKYCRRRKKSPQTFLDAKTVVKTGQTTPIKFLLDDVVTWGGWGGPTLESRTLKSRNSASHGLKFRVHVSRTFPK